MSLCKSVCVYEEGSADMPKELMNNPPSPSVPSCPSRPCHCCHVTTPVCNRQTKKKNDAHTTRSDADEKCMLRLASSTALLLGRRRPALLDELVVVLLGVVPVDVSVARGRGAVDGALAALEAAGRHL